MGCSPEAKLFFGIIPDIDDRHDVDLSDMVHEWRKHHMFQDLEQWKSTSPFNLRYVLFGYENSLRDAICCSQFYYVSEWDEVTVIPNPLPTPSQEHIDGLKAFCDHFGILWQEPQWHLVSLYF